MKRTDYKGFIRYELKDSKNKRRKGRYGFPSLVPDHTEPISFFLVGIILACRCFSNESQKTSDLVSNSMFKFYVHSSRDSIRKARESHLINKAMTLEPHGLNRRDELL